MRFPPLERKGKIKVTKLFLAIIGMVLMAVSASAQTGLGNVRWELIELNSKRVTNSKAYIEFNESEKRITGNAGCNRMFGSYELNDDVFKVSGVGSTRMACLQTDAMATEAAFLKALESATNLKKSGRNLTLYSGKARVMRFRTGTPAQSATGDLTSKKWMLRAIGGKAVTLNKDAPFLNFDAAKKGAGGNSGCNVFGGNYEATGSTIKFSDIISTMRACEFEERMTIERGFLDGLQNADKFEIKGGKLFLYKGSDLLLEFEDVAI
jgi:heat shock protein HslJ